MHIAHLQWSHYDTPWAHTAHRRHVSERHGLTHTGVRRVSESLILFYCMVWYVYVMCTLYMSVTHGAWLIMSSVIYLYEFCHLHIYETILTHEAWLIMSSVIYMYESCHLHVYETILTPCTPWDYSHTLYETILTPCTPWLVGVRKSKVFCCLVFNVYSHTLHTCLSRRCV